MSPTINVFFSTPVNLVVARIARINNLPTEQNNVGGGGGRGRSEARTRYVFTFC